MNLWLVVQEDNPLPCLANIVLYLDSIRREFYWLSRYQLEQSEPAFESIRPSKVPKLFRTCAFFQSLDTEDDAPIQVPIGATKAVTSVKCNNELSLLLSNLRYWGVDTIPDGVIGKLITKIHFRLSQSVVNIFCQSFPILKSVYKLQNSQYTNIMRQAIKMNALDLVTFLNGLTSVTGRRGKETKR